MTEINRLFTSESNGQINLNKFVTDKKRQHLSFCLPASSSNSANKAGSINYKTRRVHSKSRSPIRILIDKRSRASSANQRHKRDGSSAAGSSSENRGRTTSGSKQDDTEAVSLFNDQHDLANENACENEIDTNTAYHFQKEIRHHKSDCNTFLDINTKLRQTTGLKYFNDLALQNSIIYYATSENSLNGIIFSPSYLYDLKSQLFLRVFYNFTNACFRIKTLMDQVTSFHHSSKSQNEPENVMLVEQGVLFNLLLNEESVHQKKNEKLNNASPAELDAHLRSKMREIHFWVVGRRRLYRANKHGKWTSRGDFFICFHDAIDDILLELAFDIGFSKLAV